MLRFLKRERDALKQDGSSHASLFMERYQKLQHWALQFAENRFQAEDLLHDAFIQFTVARPDLNAIRNLDNYLCTVLRNMHVSQLRRRANSPLQTHSIIEYATADFGLWCIDPRLQLVAQDELRAIGQYACARKQHSKAASVLILRFFHGYYAEEVAKVMHCTRDAVKVWLATARTEVKQQLASRSYAQPMAPVQPPAFEQMRPETGRGGDCLADLQRQIWASRQGDCLAPGVLKDQYGRSDAIECELLAHLVSCRDCLDEVNTLLGLPLMKDRYPIDTLGRDTRRPGSGSGGSATTNPELEVRLKRHAKEVYDHVPQELFVSVNGYFIGSQKVTSAQEEQSISLPLTEVVSFVEVFSEFGVRMLLLNVDPVTGSMQQSTAVQFSNGRSLELSIDLRGLWPTLHVSYSAPGASQPAFVGAQSDAGEVALVPSNRTAPRVAEEAAPGSLRQRWQEFIEAWNARRAAVFTMAVIAFAVGLGALFLRRPIAQPLSAAVLLERSIAASEAAAHPEQVVHQTVYLEKHSSGQPMERYRIESWQHGLQNVAARRAFDENNRLFAGEWTKADSRVVYRNAKLSSRGLGTKDLLDDREIWQLTPSSDTFSRVTADRGRLTVEEQPTVYVLHYRNEAASSEPRLLRASLTLRRSDLHPVEQTLSIERNRTITDYRFVEAALEQRPAHEFAESVFRPDSELTLVATIPIPQAVMPAPSLLDYQVQALARLDEMDALIQNEVQVNRSTHGQLIVEGVLPTEERKKELLTALNRMSQKGAVSLSLNTAAEFEAQQMKSRTAPLQVQSLDVPISEMQTNEDVRRYLATRTGLAGDSLQREMQEFSDAMLDHVAEAQKHALMLRKLAQVFSWSEMESMSPQSRQQWKALVAKHALAVEREIAQVRSELAPAFGASLSTQGGPSFVDLQSAATLLTELTAKSETMLWKGLAGSSKADSATSLRNSAFWSTLQSAQELAGSIARRFQ